MDVIARFPARPDSAPPEPLAPPVRVEQVRTGRGPKRPVRSTRQPPIGRRDRDATSIFPTRSVVALAVVAAGIWGLALRNELSRRGAAPVDVADTQERETHRLASEPGSQQATDTRIAQ